MTRLQMKPKAQVQTSGITLCSAGSLAVVISYAIQMMENKEARPGPAALAAAAETEGTCSRTPPV